MDERVAEVLAVVASDLLLRRLVPRGGWACLDCGVIRPCAALGGAGRGEDAFPHHPGCVTIRVRALLEEAGRPWEVDDAELARVEGEPRRLLSGAKGRAAGVAPRRVVGRG